MEEYRSKNGEMAEAVNYIVLNRVGGV